MPDVTTGADDAQGAKPSQAQGAAAQAQGATDSKPEAGSAGTSEAVDVNALRSKNADLERDNREYRERERQREAADREAQEARLSDAERTSLASKRVEAERDELRGKLTAAETKFDVFVEAHAKGFAKPHLAYRLIAADVEYDAEGRPKNVDRLLTALLRDMPELSSATARATGSAEGGVRGGSSTANMNDLIRSAAGRA